MNRDYAEYLQALGFEAVPYGTPAFAPVPAPATAPFAEVPPPSPAPAASASAGKKAVRVLFLVADSSEAELMGSHPAGELLGKMILAMGLRIGEVRISALDAGPAAAQLTRELESYAPEMIVAMGPRAGLGVTPSAIPSVLTHAPAELLKNPALKKVTWEDLQKVMAQLGLKR